MQFKGYEPFELEFHFTCDTENVIYALTCQGCGENYIGKTEREVRRRCGEHRHNVEKVLGNETPCQHVHEHLATCGEGEFVMTPFFKVSDDDNIFAQEKAFIQHYKPRLNVRQSQRLLEKRNMHSGSK